MFHALCQAPADDVHRVSAAPYDRLRLTALRYAKDESEQYVAVVRVFTAGTAGLRGRVSRLSSAYLDYLRGRVDGWIWAGRSPW